MNIETGQGAARRQVPNIAAPCAPLDMGQAAEDFLARMSAFGGRLYGGKKIADSAPQPTSPTNRGR